MGSKKHAENSQNFDEKIIWMQYKLSVESFEEYYTFNSQFWYFGNS